MLTKPNTPFKFREISASCGNDHTFAAARLRRNGKRHTFLSRHRILSVRREYIIFVPSSVCSVPLENSGRGV